jgi:TolB protein
MRFTLGAVCLALLLSTDAEARVPGSITRLSTGSASATQTAPAISGTNVVWTDTAVSGMFVNSDIYFLDTAGSVPARNLSNTPGEQEYLEDIDGPNVVYTHTGPTMPGDILVYDTGLSGATTIAASDMFVRYTQPAVRGRYVVYVRYIGLQPDIDGFDTALGSPLAPITNDAAAQLHPRVSGDLVVFEDYNSGNADIYGYRINGGAAPFVIASGVNQQITPDVDGNWVVWVETLAPGNDRIVAYDVQNRTLRNLTGSASNKVQPRISGTRVVWADDRAGNLDIWSYDLATNMEDVVVDGPGDQMLSDIDGGRVVYTSNETGFEQIYLFTSSTPPPPPPSLPRGCDPAFTNIVGSPTTITKAVNKIAIGKGTFSAVANKTHYMCIENGLPNGTQKTAWVVAAADGKVVLTPADFKPNSNPPRWVAAKLWLDDEDDEHGCGHKHRHHSGHGHNWQAALVGHPAATVKVSIRAAK